MTPARMSLNCRDAHERLEQAHVCVYCPGCPCHDDPGTGPRARREVVQSSLAQIRATIARARSVPSQREGD